MRSSPARVISLSTATRHPPALRLKLEAIGYGFLIPVFFVSSGLRLDLDALIADPSALARVPLFLAALLVVRGVPAVLYRRRLGQARAASPVSCRRRRCRSSSRLPRSAWSIGAITPVTAAALVSAGLLSVLLFPPLALARARGLAAAPVAVRADAL